MKEIFMDSWNWRLPEDAKFLIVIIVFSHERNNASNHRQCDCLFKPKAMGTTMPWYQGSWGQHGGHLGPTGPRWALCRSHESCYPGVRLHYTVLILVRRWQMESPHKGSVIRKAFPCHNVIISRYGPVGSGVLWLVLWQNRGTLSYKSWPVE